MLDKLLSPKRLVLGIERVRDDYGKSHAYLENCSRNAAYDKMGTKSQSVRSSVAAARQSRQSRQSSIDDDEAEASRPVLIPEPLVEAFVVVTVAVAEALP